MLKTWWMDVLYAWYRYDRRYLQWFAAMERSVKVGRMLRETEEL